MEEKYKVLVAEVVSIVKLHNREFEAGIEPMFKCSFSVSVC
jgi:hypothetical protein